ncbi:hypothetical protein Plhal304r1_c059g0147751 [Plasmopara halstedii]
MVATTSVSAMIVAVTTLIDYAQAHGYIAKPPPTWKSKETNKWVGDEGLLSTFKELAAKNNYKNVRTLMDGNPAFGEDCGFTDPKGKPVDPPSDGTATFSRGIVHAGPCELWCNDKMILQNDDCQSAYGDGTQQTITVFKPVKYSLCPSGGGLLRFYWLALQRLQGKVVWQAYKNCIPLTGPGSGGGDSNAGKDSYGDSDPTQTPYEEDPTQVSPTPNNDSKSPSSESPQVAPAPPPKSKCKGARRRD